ncbi:hypothetical protein XELAEV_18016370mg [Xenopus laevis]|uniref:Uncharacterized protein n=1 Tax=Xenopus laevis TaxID=8355 RepID=A0A974HWV5_XENLA|nr:hypothetical protein XELAEV_18016370mg [Xenopus laevis]
MSCRIIFPIGLNYGMYTISRVLWGVFFFCAFSLVMCGGRAFPPTCTRLPFIDLPMMSQNRRSERCTTRKLAFGRSRVGETTEELNLQPPTTRKGGCEIGPNPQVSDQPTHHYFSQWEQLFGLCMASS